ncbi:MAG: hypothetical protein IIC75_04430 [Bacteroidetes bacterium]|nr:hypothetical protein [Bacteroidota bacterium]
MKSFFSKDNIHNFLWAIIGAFLIFVCGLIWHWWDGPQEVKIISTKNLSPDTTITIVRIEPFEIFQSTNQNREQTPTNQQVDIKIIDSLIRKALVDLYRKKTDISQNPIKISKESLLNASLQRPIFKLPSIVKGYTQGKIISYSSININKNKFDSNENIELLIEFFDSKVLSKITPIFVDIHKRKSKNSVYLIWNDQFSPNSAKSIVKFTSSFPKGNYELIVGFYLKSEINTEFPMRYSKKFNIEIQ